MKIKKTHYIVVWWLALSCWIHMYDHVILVRGEVWAHQSSLTLSRNESRRFGALKSDSTHHFYRHACTKSESQFSQFSGCWLILFVYIIMSFDFPSDFKAPNLRLSLRLKVKLDWWAQTSPRTKMTWSYMCIQQLSANHHIKLADYRCIKTAPILNLYIL
jgi:hypothetical protein